MSIRHAAFAFAGIVALAVLYGCYGGAHVDPDTGVIVGGPVPTCSPGVAVQMVYPIPGATGVPNAPIPIVFAVSSQVPGTYAAVVSTSAVPAGGQGTSLLFLIEPTQIPKPSATPSFSPVLYEQA